MIYYDEIIRREISNNFNVKILDIDYLYKELLELNVQIEIDCLRVPIYIHIGGERSLTYAVQYLFNYLSGRCPQTDLLDKNYRNQTIITILK